jgi:hypothetical protein
MLHIANVIRRALALLGIAFVGGCAGAPATAPGEITFAGAPLETVTSSGGLHIEMRWSPSSPVKGADAVELTFLDAAGAIVDGLDVAVVPWMPAHGHGTSVQPETTASATGTLIASPLYLYMSGEWQVRMTISGALDDTAVADVQIP